MELLNCHAEWRPKRETRQHPPRSAPADSGLRCPECEYNLTGLTRPRCPECGTTFDWDEVRQAAANRPLIAFERARRWRKLPAFFVTWATILFAPWIFARQIVAHVDWRHALAFAGICFAGTSLAYLFGLDLDFQATWLLTALIYILLQMLWLSALSPAGWRKLRQTLRFWLLAGCYTSAVMLTEIVHGPPPLFLEELWSFITTGDPDSWMDELYQLSVSGVVHWLQLGLWLAALGCIYAKRTAERPSAPGAVVRGSAVCLSLLILYAAVVQWIGQTIAGWF